MPRTFGRNQIHVSQVAGWTAIDRPLVAVEPSRPSEVDSRIAAHVAERIPNGATIQAGIGSIPSALLAGLGEHRDLGVHTELLSDARMQLVESGVVSGAAEAVGARQGRYDVRSREPEAVRLSRRELGRRVPSWNKVRPCGGSAQGPTRGGRLRRRCSRAVGGRAHRGLAWRGQRPRSRRGRPRSWRSRQRGAPRGGRHSPPLRASK